MGRMSRPVLTWVVMVTASLAQCPVSSLLSCHVMSCHVMSCHVMLLFALGACVQVDKQDVVSATVANVDLHLDMLRGAIGSLGGKVEVAEVANGKAVLKYQVRM